jgi:hypothetical protein
MEHNITTGFLPISKVDLEIRGWEQLDFLFISGDAYVDHPSFGAAILTRLLENEGYRVGMIAQPDWKDPAAFTSLGRPRLGVLISSGVIDSMVNHYTAGKKKRRDDVYSPGGQAGFRPDRAVIVYTNRIREVFKNIPVIIGGIEASLRRFAHYDYWSDTVRRSILIDARADLLVYGMGERPIPPKLYCLPSKWLKQTAGNMRKPFSINIGNRIHLTAGCWCRGTATVLSCRTYRRCRLMRRRWIGFTPCLTCGLIIRFTGKRAAFLLLMRSNSVSPAIGAVMADVRFAHSIFIKAGSCNAAVKSRLLPKPKL